MTENTPKIQKETKNKIRVDFERTPLKDRLKARFLSLFFLKKIIWFVFRMVLLVGISYIVLFPFIAQIAGSFMTPTDIVDPTVLLLAKKPTLDIYKAIWTDQSYVTAFINTFVLSASTALIQTFVCCFVAYGLAKFKFKGNKILFLMVIFSLVIPHQTLQLSLFMNFRNFDIFGIFGFLEGGGITIFGKTFFKGLIDVFPETPKGMLIFTENGITLTNTYWPLIILSIGGLAFKNGLYIFMLRQFFKGVPDELEESAYIDGSGVIRTFFQIILPLSIPMLITVFLFAFSWQWTDDFYTKLFFTNINMNDMKNYMMPDIVGMPGSLKYDGAGQENYRSVVFDTCGIMIILPLVIMYLFCQKYLVQGIERSGLTAD